MSVADIAKAVGKSAQGVHYHVDALEAVGLLLAVDTRRRRSRTESLYVHKARGFVSQGRKGSAEYRAHSQKAFAAMTRDMARENEALHLAVEADPEIAEYYTYNRRSLLVSFDDAMRIRSKLAETAAEFEDSTDEEGRIRINLITYMSPKAEESKAITRKNQKKKKQPRSEN